MGDRGGKRREKQRRKAKGGNDSLGSSRSYRYIQFYYGGFREIGLWLLGQFRGLGEIGLWLLGQFQGLQGIGL